MCSSDGELTFFGPKTPLSAPFSHSPLYGTKEIVSYGTVVSCGMCLSHTYKDKKVIRREFQKGKMTVRRNSKQFRRNLPPKFVGRPAVERLRGKVVDGWISNEKEKWIHRVES